MVAGDERIWITIPMRALKSLAELALQLQSLSYDARNGVASSWCVDIASKEPRQPGYDAD
jgi:hypothetical protein